MDYKTKYLKYKAKYINLKNQLGGACPESNPDDPSEKINPTNPKGLLRAYLKAVSRPNDGEFGAVKSGTKINVHLDHHVNKNHPKLIVVQ